MAEQHIPTFYRDRAEHLRKLEKQVLDAFQSANFIARQDRQENADLDDAPEIERMLRDCLIEIKTALARTEPMADLELDLTRALSRREPARQESWR